MVKITRTKCVLFGDIDKTTHKGKRYQKSAAATKLPSYQATKLQRSQIRRVEKRVGELRKGRKDGSNDEKDSK
jgi:hypothetical protein